MKLFFIVLHALAVASLAAPPRGVQTKNLGMYEPNSKKFRCLDGSFEIPFSHINDEYCDCADGSDEPGTPACTFEGRFSLKNDWRFQCTDTKYMSKEILHTFINDGICDCCDGSDEYAGVTECPNTCAEAHKKAEAERLEREAKREIGLVAKKTMISEAQSQRSSLKKVVEESQQKLNTLTQERDDLEKQKNALEQTENEEKAAIKAKSEAEYELWKAAREAKKEELAALEKLQPTTNEVVICSKWRQTKECVGSGERVPEDDKECDSVIPDGWSGYCDCFDTESNAEVRYEFDCGHKPLRCNFVCSHNGAEPESVETIKEEEFKIDDGSSYESQEAREARDSVQRKRREIEDTERAMKSAEEDLARDFGPDDALLSLKGKCFELEQREYNYKLCPFVDVQQIRKGNSHGTIMGRWKGFGEQSYSSWGSKQDYSHLIFTDGEHCWGGPNRNTDVHAVCGASNKLLSVEEPSMCTYKMVFETPAACE